MKFKTQTLERVIAQLKATRALLDAPGAWTKGGFARNAKGNIVDVKSQHACSHCIVGAIRKVTRTSAHRVLSTPAYKFVYDALTTNYLDWDAVAKLNDKRSTTHEQVMFALDFTLAQAKDELKASLKK